MALDPVSKIRIVTHSSDRDDILSLLESSGRVHLAGPPSGLEDWLRPVAADTTGLSESIEDLDGVISFLRDYAEKPGLGARLTQVPQGYDLPGLEALASDFDLLWKARRAWRVAMVMSERQGDARELAAEVAFLESWRGLPVRFEDLGTFGSVTACAGTAPLDALDVLREAEERVPLLSVQVLQGSSDVLRILAAWHSSVQEEARQALSECGFSVQEFGARKASPADLLRSVRLKLRALEIRHARLEKEAASLARDLPRFEALRDAAGLMLERSIGAKAGLESDRLFVIECWVRDRDLEPVAEILSGAGAVHIEKAAPAEGEVPPAALTEGSLADPYLMLTDMFGRPAPGDPDPTPLMAPFYAFFFGICIGDAGYGIVVALSAWMAGRITARKGGRNRLFEMIFHGGLAAVLVGSLLGGWFGMDRSRLPSFLLGLSRPLDSLVPDGGPFALSRQFLYTTMALGIVQLLTGIVVNFDKRWRAGERLTAILEQGGWVLSLAGLFPWLFNHYLLGGVLYDTRGPLDGIFLLLLLAGAVLIFVMGGREARGFGRFGLGAMAAYGIVNLLADALSYSRLFALSLSGGIIASVVNQIAAMLPGTDIPIAGLFISIPVIVLGHLFNILMSLLGGYIHTARLQFVEFFGKFYEGTGSPFVPFRYDPQFVRVVRRKTPKGETS